MRGGGEMLIPFVIGAVLVLGFMSMCGLMAPLSGG